MSPTLLLVVALACTRPAEDSGIVAPAPDLTERLDDTEARAGVIIDDSVLFEGISAEGRVGDLLVYNNKVRFVLQGLRPGSFYMEASGQVIDADIVRPAGMPGRDIIDEFSAMVGFGRLVSPSAVEVIADGSDGQAAVIQVTGRGSPMALLVGALESDSIVPDLQVAVTTT